MKHIFTCRELMSILALAIVFFSCQSPAKLFEKQKYDASIEKAIKKIAKGKNIDPSLRLTLESAFLAATTRDMDRITRLESSSQINNWDMVYTIAERIELRQNTIEPYLPIYDDHGYRADFKFVKTKDIKKLAASKASEKYYRLASERLEEGRRGEKSSAREAFVLYHKIDKYDNSYLDAQNLTKEARDLGTTFVHFEVIQSPSGRLPSRIRRELDRFSFNLDKDDWLVVEFNPQRDRYDYHIAYRIDEVDVTPDQYRESIIHEEKDVESIGYQIDSRGRYVLDTLGNKIQVKSVEVAKATVVKVYQSKEAIILGDLIITDLSTSRIIDREPVSAHAVFEKQSCTYRGDERALSGDLPDFGPPVPFPHSDDLLLDVIKNLEIAFSKRLRGIDFI